MAVMARARWACMILCHNTYKQHSNIFPSITRHFITFAVYDSLVFFFTQYTAKERRLCNLYFMAVEPDMVQLQLNFSSRDSSSDDKLAENLLDRDY